MTSTIEMNPKTGPGDEPRSSPGPVLGNSTLRPGGLSLTEHALAVCQFAGGARVLDVGCGAADTVADLRARHGLNAFGLDLAPAAHFSLPKSSLSWIVQADGMRLPIGAAQLDGVLCECTLSLLPEPAQAMRGFARALRPGGCLVLSDLYARDSVVVQPANGRGALGRPELDWLLARLGFETLLWEDHTGELMTFVGRMIFERGALPSAWRAAAATAPRLGYFLLVARRP